MASRTPNNVMPSPVQPATHADKRRAIMPRKTAARETNKTPARMTAWISTHWKRAGLVISLSRREARYARQRSCPDFDSPNLHLTVLDAKTQDGRRTQG